MAPNTRSKEEHLYEYVELNTLPSFSKLQSQVQNIVKTSSWWDLYGVDWMHIAGAVAAVPLGLFFLAFDSWVCQALGIFLLGCYNGLLSNKSGHLGAHGALARSTAWNQIWTRIFVDFVGGFSSKLATDIHVKVHHPHTNIIGLGDSSTWKVPGLSRIPYMFFAPLTVPILIYLVSIQQLLLARDWLEFFFWSVISTSGIAFHTWLLVHFSGFSVAGGLLCLLAYKATLGIPYIHINIFQHIGLPMFDKENRPKRIYQMSTGVLNLTSNRFLNATFGHSLISCHVEHHLFSKLSDNMCLKIRPTVKKYLVENGLRYNEDSYTHRLLVFLRDYDELMVNAPPITHFVGIQ